MDYLFKINDGEYWWGGSSNDGTKMPFCKSSCFVSDFRLISENQTMPMFLSNQGRCIWSDEPFKINIKNGEIAIEGNDVTLEVFGTTLKEAYIGAMKKHFPFNKNFLPEEFFQTPQYNTWMQFTYFQSQDGVLQYAHDILKNGFKPGILIIDEGWQKDYGDWSFDLCKFPNPKAMVDELHEMGFKVMLWVVPYVRCDGLFFINHTLECLKIEAYTENLFLRDKDGEIFICHWWNGYSAILDFTKEQDRLFMDKQLKALMNNIGIDGFKFDGGTLEDYTGNNSPNKSVNEDHTPAERNIAWNEFGAGYTYHEYKDSFKLGGKCTIQRLRDKFHTWGNGGLAELVPNAIVQGLLGYPFVCPDMVGGGEWLAKARKMPVDMELFVRMAECSALFPMMQFSWAPWDALDKPHLGCVKRAHDLHIEFSDQIWTLVQSAAKTGEPILRNLEYNYPGRGFEKINDEFMLGEEILVAPIVQKGQKTRSVQLPKGIWRGFDEKTYVGDKTYEINVTLADLPYFVLQK